MIRKSEYRDSIVLQSRWAVRPLDILQAINELNPDITLQKAFEQAKASLALENISEIDIPVLYAKEGIDPDNFFIVIPKSQVDFSYPNTLP